MVSYKDKMEALRRVVADAADVCPRAVAEIRHLRAVSNLSESGSSSELFITLTDSLSAESKTLLGVGSAPPDKIVAAIVEILNFTMMLEVSTLTASVHDLKTLLPQDRALTPKTTTQQNGHQIEKRPELESVHRESDFEDIDTSKKVKVKRPLKSKKSPLKGRSKSHLSRTL